jgi:pentose-5-phosphate-3-epimerase
MHLLTKLLLMALNGWLASQICNHFQANGCITTKIGLCRNTRKVSVSIEDATPCSNCDHSLLHVDMTHVMECCT